MALRKEIDKQGNTRYIIDYYPHGRKGRRVVFKLPEGTSEDDAKKLHQGVLDRRDQTRQASPSGNIARLIKKYVEFCELHQSPDTVRDKRSSYDTHIIPFFGHLHVTDLVNAHITAFKQQMKGKTYREKLITNKTITKTLNYFSAFLKWCSDDLDIRPPAQLHFRKLPHTRPVPTVLTLEEAIAFINAANDRCRHASTCRQKWYKCIYKVPYRTLFKIYFYLGLRKSAALRLRWTDVDWAKHAVKTVEKRGKVRWHPLPDDLHEELRALYITSGSEFIFPSPRDPRKPLNNPLKAVARAKKKAGITKRVYPHLLRHSIATHLIDSDVDIRQIQEFLGHTHVSTTEFYTQVSLEKKRQALEKAGIKTSKM